MSGTDATPAHGTTSATDLPIVSIGLPVYNGGRHLERAARSILDQDFKALELIIVDNASDDDTAAIAQRLVASDSRVQYYRNSRNLGAAPNFCRAFELARGQYFKWAAYDDWLEPRFLSACLEVFEREPATVLVFPGTNVYDESGDIVRQYRHSTGLTSDSAAKRFFNSLWNWKYATAIFGLIRVESLKKTHLIQSYKGSDRLLLSELVLLGDIRELGEYLFNSTETISVRRGRDSTWWTTEIRARPTFDRWKLLGDYLGLVVRTPRFGIAQRMQMTVAVLGFFCRRWPRGELFDELRTGAKYVWHRS